MSMRYQATDSTLVCTGEPSVSNLFPNPRRAAIGSLNRSPSLDSASSV